MAVKTINAEMLQKMFLAGAANLEAKKEIHQRTERISCSRRRYRYKYDADDHVSSKRSKSFGESEYGMPLQKRFHPVHCEVPAEIRVLSFPSFFADSRKRSGNMKRSMSCILARACERATATAYKAVMKPKEGTILTVAKGIAEKAAELG